MADSREAASTTKMSDAQPQDLSMLDAQARVPQHVVYREFVNETVMLNLQTGTYHGLNPTAGRMIMALERAETLREAASKLAGENGWELATVEHDLLGLCQRLAESGLIELSRDHPK
jgi:hypothetical protein